MHELLKLQESFYRNIFKKDVDLSFISSDFSQERLDVYRQTIFENMINALRITYPGVWKLIGNECANSVAYTYCKKDK
ncbi:TPA: DNA-binding domain-containing protein, partial [Legionella pneumophila]